MTDERLQRLNVRAIQVTLESSLRHAGPEEAQRCVARAQQLLEAARRDTHTPELVHEVEVAQSRLKDRLPRRDFGRTN